MTNIPHAKFTVHQKRRRVGDGSRQTVHEGAATDKVASAVSKLSYQDFVEHQMCPPGAITTIAVASNVTFEHSALFVAGRYCKLMRGISNSIWIIGGKKITEDSIEELVGNPLLEFFGATSMKFCSAGREDADVLMLGTGRPFYFEIINPTRGFATMEEMNLLQEQIIERAKNKVGLLDLQIVPRDTIAVLKQSANTKKKSYQCLVQLSEPASPNDIEIINQMKDIEVSQKNPTRIPRRADLTRSKIVHEINVRISPSQANELIVDLTTSAGTYVKEFMHSDGDRTVPSLKSLLNVTNVTVVSLDVLQVHLDWPPALNKA
jgi:tRNA pseudouridine synthase 10